MLMKLSPRFAPPIFKSDSLKTVPANWKDPLNLDFQTEFLAF
jgi:hypothetical protein